MSFACTRHRERPQQEQKAEEPDEMSEQASFIDTTTPMKMPTRKQRKAQEM